MKIKCIVFGLLIILGQGLYATEQSQGIVTVAVVVNSVRSKTARYIYKDVRLGLKRKNINAKIIIKSYGDLNKDILKSYNAVIVVSEKQRNRIDPDLIPFITRNAKDPRLIVLSFMPGKNPVLTNVPEGIDALSSSSRESPAKKYVLGPVVMEIIKRLGMDK